MNFLYQVIELFRTRIANTDQEEDGNASENANKYLHNLLEEVRLDFSLELHLIYG